MKTLEQIKNEFAKDLGYYNWENLMTEVCYFSNEEFFNHENELLILVQKECLQNAFNSEVNSGVCETVANRIADDQNIIR